MYVLAYEYMCISVYVYDWYVVCGYMIGMWYTCMFGMWYVDWYVDVYDWYVVNVYDSYVVYMYDWLVSCELVGGRI